MDQEKEQPTSKLGEIGSNLGIDNEPVKVIKEPEKKNKKINDDEYIEQIISHIPTEYRNVDWSDFTGKYENLATVARNFFQEICDDEINKYKYSLPSLIYNSFNISIIGENHSGVSTLGYLLLLESVWRKQHVFSTSWNTLVYEMNDVYYRNGDRESFKLKYTDPDVLFIDSIEESSLRGEIVILGLFLEDRYRSKNKLTIGGFNVVPNSKSFGNEFYNKFSHGPRCLRVFLSPYEILPRSGCVSEIDQIGIGGRHEKLDEEIKRIIETGKKKWPSVSK